MPRLAQREAHEVLVTRKEAVAHSLRLEPREPASLPSGIPAIIIITNPVSSSPHIRALGVLCASLILALAMPATLSSPPALAAPRAGRPRGMSSAPSNSTAQTDTTASTTTPTAAPYAPGMVVVGYGSCD